MKPNNEYVQRFVEGVDFSKVITASRVMKRAESITLGKDGIRVALKRMKNLGLSSIFVVDRNKRLVGAITAEKAAAAIQSGSEDLESLLEKNVPQTDMDTPLYELFEEAAVTTIPIAVVDHERRLRGVIVRGAILAALSGNGVRKT